MSTAGEEIVVYVTPDGEIRVDVRLEQESVWLTQRQISELFDTSTDNIGLHLKNIFHEGELEESATAEDSSVVQMEGKRRVTRTIKHYNLDAIISVGYRVNSKRGTQFRILATQILRDHLVKGYSVNQARLEELQPTVRLVATMAERRDLSGDEATALLHMVSEYSRALDLLDEYDHQRVPASMAGSQTRYALTYEEAIGMVDRLRERFGDSAIFAQEKDESLHSSLQAIMQTFGGQDLYPNLEGEEATYFISW
ncbi:MAG: virulence RhuM family protein [Nitrospiraceae bacterium]|nr:virulence RhuM family protein [Nitrospiraceae bacterium]